MIDWILKFLEWLLGRIKKKSEIVEILKLYEERLNEKERRIQELEERGEKIRKGFEREKSDKEKELKRIIKSIEKNKILKEKLIEKFDKPLNIIFLSYSTQKVKNKRRFVTSHFIKGELERYNAKYLGGTDVIIPPSEPITKELKTRKDLQNWFEKQILKGRFCRIKFLALVDLRKIIWHNFIVPNIKRKKLHHTIGEVLELKDIFAEDELSKLSLKNIIEEGDIGWLASSCLSEKEANLIYLRQREIEKELGNPSLRILADNKQIPTISKVLESHNIPKPDEVAKAIVEEAKFWNEKLR